MIRAIDSFYESPDAPWNREPKQHEESEEVCVIFNTEDGDAGIVPYDEYIKYPKPEDVSTDYIGWRQEGIMSMETYEECYSLK